jgi:hypothetical protein
MQMKSFARLLAAFAIIAGSHAGDTGQFTYVIEGTVTEVTTQGIIVDCPASDRVGYKRAIGPSLVFGYPQAVQEGARIRCFGEILGGGTVGGPVQFKFLRQR